MVKFGGIEVVEQQEMKMFTQRAASAWGVMNDLVGANYKPMAYVGTQIVKGVNHFFIAEQTLVTATPIRHIVLVTINEFDGNYSLVSVENIV